MQIGGCRAPQHPPVFLTPLLLASKGSPPGRQNSRKRQCRTTSASTDGAAVIVPKATAQNFMQATTGQPTTR